jgi:uncharacterized membrane protein
MKKGLSLIGSIGLGASLMYLLDPQQGERRRSLARDQVVHLLHKSGDAIGPTARDLRNRTRGLFAETASLLMNREVPDNVLVARVRSRLGRHVSHPGSIEVSANQGRVTLSGPILSHELERLLAAVAETPGVAGIENRLEAHKQPGDVPGLQGGSVPPSRMQANWSPSARLLAGTVGSTLTLFGAKQGGLMAKVLGALGLTMLVRALTNLELKRLFGVGAGRRAVDLQKTIEVAAPVERVFEFWSNFENFPRFMANVREVRDLGNGRSHWTVDGPAGVPLSWNAIITKHIPNEVLAWRSEPGSVIRNAGIVHFTPNREGGTQIHIDMSYNPPAGALGHGVASLFGDNPKHAMDEDLARFKSLLEEGKTTAKGATVTHEEMVQEATPES